MTIKTIFQRSHKFNAARGKKIILFKSKKNQANIPAPFKPFVHRLYKNDVFIYQLSAGLPAAWLAESYAFKNHRAKFRSNREVCDLRHGQDGGCTVSRDLSDAGNLLTIARYLNNQ